MNVAPAPPASLAPPREPLHRAMSRLPMDRRSTIAGLVVAAVLVVSAFAFAASLWRFEARAVATLLRMSDTPYTTSAPATQGLFHGAVAGGAKFRVPGTSPGIGRAGAVAGIVAFGLATIVAVRWRRVPVPAKMLWLLFATVGSVTLWHTGFGGGVPPTPVRTLTIGFQRGGLLTVVVASLLFAFEIFPVPGPFRIKAGWLAGLVIFSIAWSVVRMAVVLATAHHLGPWTFLYLHYLAGPVVDFLAVVAFYSFATYGLARRLPAEAAR